MMSGYLLHQGATVQCLHGGQAQPMVTSQKVKVGGQFIVHRAADPTEPNRGTGAERLMNASVLSCREERRRKDTRAAPLFGLDFVEVSEDQVTLEVFFLGKAPPVIALANVRISGGRRVRDVQVTGLSVRRQPDPTLDDSLEVRVSKPGDFSIYTLSLVKLDDQGHPTTQSLDGFDPRYDKVEFSFKAGCPSDLDCQVEQICPPPQRSYPEINYLAKDYASFRQLILDRLALLMPDWQEKHIPDIGITLVELLAYVGDYLSYYQEAVATEAYLGTARQRISVRRHVRLVDYTMHEGCNSRTWVTIHTDITDTSLKARQIFFTTTLPGMPNTHVLQPTDWARVPRGNSEVFEPLVDDAKHSIQIYAAHNEIQFYAWGDCECCLAPGSTTATLLDEWVPADAADRPVDGPSGTKRSLNLRVGDVLIFEEVIGPGTGNAGDADPKHRQAVLLTEVTPAIDPLYHQLGFPDHGKPVVEIEWCAEDALTFPLCISAKMPPPDCTCREKISVARGNVILVDNGSAIEEPLGVVPTGSVSEHCPTDCEPAEIVIWPEKFRPTLKQRPLTFAQPLPRCGCAAALVTQDPRQALPAISLSSIPPAPLRSGTSRGQAAEPLFGFADIDDPLSVAQRLRHPANPASQYLRARISEYTRQRLDAWDGSSATTDRLRGAVVSDLTALLETWTPKRDLLESASDDRDFAVETDNDGYAHLRFGDGELAQVPEAGTMFRASYRVGNGVSGNVGAETITCIVFREITDGVGNLVPRNPVPAVGGRPPEPLTEAKMFAPHAFRKVLERAITADDYAALAADNTRRLAERPALLAAAMGNGKDVGTLAAPASSSQTSDDPRRSEEEEPGDTALLGPDICLVPFRKLQGAKGTLRWNGSWYEALVAVDPLGTEEVEAELLDEVAAYLEPYRRIGHDLEVKPANYVGLDLAMAVCVLPQYLRGHVEAALLDVFSNRILPDGRLGFFHADNLTFGEGVFVSRIVAAAQAVPGVMEVQVTKLKRFEIGQPAPDQLTLPPHGVLPLGPFEIARLDNDPSIPENGRLVVDIRGGR
jgi:hypothetical protein